MIERGLASTAHSPNKRNRTGMYMVPPHLRARGVGAGGEIARDIIGQVLPVFGDIFGGGRDRDDDQQPVIIQMPAPNPFPWKPLLIGGGILFGAFLLYKMTKRGR